MTGDDLKTRLLDMYSHRGGGIPTQHVNPDGPEAVARIEALEAQLATTRPDVLEEAAKVANKAATFFSAGENNCCSATADEIATAIRALGDAP